MAKKRQYSDREKAEALAALAANGGNVKRTAGHVGIPERTLSYWSKGGVNGDVAKDCDQKKADLAAELEALAFKLCGHCGLPKTIADATLIQAATAMGIAVDKLLALRGVNVGDGRTPNPVIYLPDNGRGPAGGHPAARPPV